MNHACVFSISMPATLAIPKSAIFTCPSHGMSTLDGFTSRWMTGENSPVWGSLAECAAESASKMRQATNIAALSSKGTPRGLRSARSLWSGIPSTYSSTMTSCPLSEKKSKSFTMAGWDRRA